MSDDRARVGDETRESQKSEKSGLSPAQVVAAALSAVVAAFLCSTLGVYGTVIGAGLLSVVTTVGSELFTRSLERTRKAARAARTVSRRRGRGDRRGGQPDPDRTVYLPAPTREQLDEYAAAMERTRVLASSGAAENSRARRQWWRRRGPVLAATSALAFVIGMLVVTGYEGVTGKALSGDGATTFSSIVRGDSGPGGENRSPRDGDVDDERQRDEATSSTPTSEPDAEPGAGRDAEEPESETAPTGEPEERTETPEPTRPSESTSVSEQPSEPARPTHSEEPAEEQAPSYSRE